MRRRRDSGVVLVNVLVIIALSAAVVHLMLSSRESAIDRVTGLSRAGDAELIALGAEASVVAALRRDLDQAPDVDHFGEAWAAIAQEEVQLVTGRFSVEIQDLQRKYDINRLALGGLGPVEVLARLLVELDQPPELARRIAAILRRTGPVGALSDLEGFGIPAAAIEALSPHVAVLPSDATVNLNTVEPPLLRAMLNNRAIAARLIARRDREGQITREALRGAGAVRPDHSGFTSNLFDVVVLAEADGAAVRMESRIRRSDALSAQSVSVVSRRYLPLPSERQDAPDP
ncbi:general secretion pathway protein GspK [Roseivivax sp. GX 12232]|uniref:general secretion pathway protein GspK n=1 Tax=Roseivivax sp. GX 12232 TaxID=2900547 RepID=UPI001E449EAE|nr:type II secretion system protein GspK [Roseivivax sp. GX 12232]MCE0507395.1 general secretion pathway protein GspK [Roseivivax sp. GX 12232]